MLFRSQEYKKLAEESSELLSGEGITTKVDIKGKKVTAVMEADLSKMDDDAKKNVEDTTYDEAKKEEADKGFSCK